MHPIHSSTRWQRAACLVLLMFGMFVLYVVSAGPLVWATPGQSPLRQTVPTLTPTPIPAWMWMEGNAPDYAPSGMPDFDQKQWTGGGGQGSADQSWTLCGPVAISDILWWLDSRAEPGQTPPPAASDGYDLVASFGSSDDHDPQNVVPLVNDVAQRLGTRTTGEQTGTDVAVVTSRLQSYLLEKGLQASYAVTMFEGPSFEQLLAWVRHGDGVALLLGFWEWQGDRWVYLGGHYVAVAGAEPMNRFVAVSDPFRDAFEAGRTLLGRSPMTHSYPHTVEVHNDAQYASHDAYPLVAAEGPGGTLALKDYIDYWNAYEEVQNFIGQNVPATFESYYDYYSGSAITTKLDYAIVVSSPYALYLPIILRRPR